ncbi:MAG: recombinase family protein, partial [Syntrophomonadaceae bacterium]|nr:recombinase family protein [Syntrophomonadaceae bacterium]
MKAAVYLRVSTEDQARNGYSLNEQREACRQKARSLGADKVVEYADEGVSGGILDRPGLNRLREAVRAGQLDLVVVRDPDRLSRKLSHQLLLTEEMEKAGVSLQFLDFEWQDTPDGRLFYAIRGAIAEYEKEKIRERMSRGRLQKARQGGIPVGFHSYGYVYQRGSGQVLPHPEEARVVQQIYRWFIEEDLGINGIADRLNRLQMPSRSGGRWHRQVVKQILKNPVYLGRWRFRDVYVEVPALVEKEEWESAQSRLKAARRLWAGRRRQQYLLSGLIACGECGNTANGVLASWWGKKERRYTCRKNYPGAKNRGCSPPCLLPAEPIERAVWEAVKSWLNDADRLAEEVLKQQPKKEEVEQELARAEWQIAENEKGRARIIDA